MIEWFKKLLHIVDRYADDKRQAQNALAQLENAHKRLLNEMASLDRRMTNANGHALSLEKTLKEMVDTSVDVSPYDGRHHVIMAGRFKGNDYVRSFTVRCEDFSYLINVLKDMERISTIRHIDAPPEFRRAVMRGLES